MPLRRASLSSVRSVRNKLVAHQLGLFFSFLLPQLRSSYLPLPLHGFVTPADFKGHEGDIYEAGGKTYRRIFLVIDRIAVRPKTQ